MRFVAGACLALLALPGCGWNPLAIFGGGATPGVVTGIVQYGGAPARGKAVSLISGSTVKAQTVTDANGRYSFKGVSGTVQVFYASTADYPPTTADGKCQVCPNELAKWYTQQIDGAAGQEVPPFDVAYNGLLYPDATVALVLNKTSPVPFHWSVQAQAQRYRAHVFQDKTSFTWRSQWDSQPTAVIQQDIVSGTYMWEVEIDGGDAGSGLTASRPVAF